MKKQKRYCQQSFCSNMTEDGSNFCQEHRPKSTRVRKNYERWYSSAQWQRIRTNQLITEPLCRECKNNGILRTATEVDHIKPHQGNWTLFTDKNNLQSLCKQCHSQKTWQENNIKPKQT